jgi:hypothetical protein
MSADRVAIGIGLDVILHQKQLFCHKISLQNVVVVCHFFLVCDTFCILHPASCILHPNPLDCLQYCKTSNKNYYGNKVKEEKFYDQIYCGMDFDLL